MIFRITASVPRRGEKRLTSALFASGAMSVERAASGDAALSVLADEPHRDAVLSLLEAYAPVCETLEEKDWQNEWVSSFKGCELAPGIHVIPSGSGLPPREGISIFIDPRDAFGSGTHPTTRLCARLLRGAVRSYAPSSFLDIGTGTGILAILASRLGVPRVEGYDIDGAAVSRAKENLLANGCAGVKLCRSGIEPPAEPFDLVCANVNSAVIERYFGAIAASVSCGGALILSGIGAEWRTQMERLFSSMGFIVESALEDEGWLGYLLTPERAE